MKVVLESSSLFFKEYTGIPFYILNLHRALLDQKDVDPILGFRLKNFFKKQSDPLKELLDHPHVWYASNLLLPFQKAAVAHTLHTPFLNLKGSLKVATVHDLAVHLPEFDSYNFASQYFKDKRFKLFEEFTKKADAIITVSEATKSDFLRFFDYPEERIHAVPLAPSKFSVSTSTVASDEILNRFGLTDKGYFLFVGGISLRKNTLNLIKGYHFSKSKNDFKLVITGKIQEDCGQKVREFIAKNNLEDDVIITNYLEKGAVQALYSHAKAFLFPTFYEGFGIPILEAMHHGLPVLTSITGAAPETSGGHAILVDPFSPEHIGDGIDQLDTFDVSRLQSAKFYAEQHTWQRTAQMTVDVYKQYL